MPVFMVERELRRITMEELATAQKKAIQMGKELTAHCREVRYIRSTFVPGEDNCMCLFEAPNSEHVVKPTNVRRGPDTTNRLNRKSSRPALE